MACGEREGGMWFIQSGAGEDATLVGLGNCLGLGPKVGLCAAGQPWAEGRNPVGIGGV